MDGGGPGDLLYFIRQNQCFQPESDQTPPVDNPISSYHVTDGGEKKLRLEELK